MRIAVNTRFLLKDYLEGYGICIVELFKRIVTAHPEHEFYFIFDRPYDPSFIFSENVKAVVAGPPARHPVLWSFWYNIRVPAILRKIKADVFISPDGFCSATTRVPQLLMIHDLAFLHYPSFISKSHLRFYRNNTGKFIDKAKNVITVSEFTKKDIVDQYAVVPDKVKVIYNGARDIFSPIDFDEAQKIKQRYSEGKEYFIYVGSIHPRKNLFHLLKAFSVFKKRLQSNMKLLIVGRLAWQYEEFTKSLGSYKYKDDVQLLQHINDPELTGLLAAACALVYPSYFEGFGMPIVEAMRCGVPVICSNTSSMPEVSGDAALLADPSKHEEIAEAMMTLYKDENLRSELIRKGFERAKQFEWDNAASSFWKEIVATAQA